jgi:hypothetical protein
MVERVFDRGERGDDALRCAGEISVLLYARCSGRAHRGISDLAVLLRDVEVDADENALALEVEVGDRELVRERHGERGRGSE